MTNEVIDTDRGYAEFTKKLVDASGYQVTVGIHEEDNETPEDSDVSVVDYATFNEFGMGVPQRSFMLSTADEKREEWGRLSGELWGKVLDGKILPKTAMEVLGIKAQSDVRRKITTLKEPANAPATIAAKGSSNPLIDEGTMRRLIAYKVTKS